MNNSEETAALRLVPISVIGVLRPLRALTFSIPAIIPSQDSIRLNGVQLDWRGKWIYQKAGFWKRHLPTKNSSADIHLLHRKGLTLVNPITYSVRQKRVLGFSFLDLYKFYKFNFLF